MLPRQSAALPSTRTGVSHTNEGVMMFLVLSVIVFKCNVFVCFLLIFGFCLCVIGN